MNKDELWQAVLAQIQFNISPTNFATWLKNTSILSKKEDQVIISVPNNFSKEWLENKYNKLIFKILHNLDENIKEVKYKVTPTNLKIKELPVEALSSLEEKENQLKFQEFKIDKETNLNPRYTFENFIVGPFNELPHAAAQAIVKNPGWVYNPLFIYGGVGLGKTHLLQAIGNALKNLQVKYIPSDKFKSGVVSSIRNQSLEKFKSIYQNIEVLIIDDVQFLAGKEKTQEEFFHVFNALYEKNKQIVISSDRPPKAISALEERLKSRFEGGMIADIGFPDFETRMAILKAKNQDRKVNFSEEVLEYIASNIQHNIRELEGALNRLMVFQKVNNYSPDLETTKTLLKNIISGPTKVINAKKIIQIVAEFYDLNQKELFMPLRKKEIVKPRQIAMYLLREELKNSFPYIGKKLGKKDHTTAIYAHYKISKQIETNQSLAEEINLIRQRIHST